LSTLCWLLSCFDGLSISLCLQQTPQRQGRQKYNKLETLQSSASERPRYIPKSALIHYLNVCHSGKNSSRSVKKQRLWWLNDICHPAKYGRSRSSHRRTGTGKPKSRSRRFDFFAKVKVTYVICQLRPFRATWLCMITFCSCNSRRDMGF